LARKNSLNREDGLKVSTRNKMRRYNSKTLLTSTHFQSNINLSHRLYFWN